MTDSIDPEYKEQVSKHGFDLKEKIGSGLSGKVIRAVQKRLNRDVAIKFFDNTLSLKDHNLRQRFLREAQLLAKLHHPSIPYVLTNGDVSLGETKIPYIVMQFINGRSLEEIIRKKKKLPLEDALNYAEQILSALAEAHSKKIIHRDVKPANILVTDSGRCFLIDFSIGVCLENSTNLVRATLTGDHLGTFSYMAPEQKENMLTVDHRADIYSMGIVFYEMLVGHTRYDSGKLRIELSEFPQYVIETIEKACSVNANERFDSALDFSRSISFGMKKLVINKKPATALCKNILCPDADWSPNGYYRKPAIFHDCTNSFCTSCGNKLIYSCSHCDMPFSETPYCGNCGNEFAVTPVCGKCGSFLRRMDMKTDTSKDGCSRCRVQEIDKKNTDFNEDIPF